MSVAGCFFGLLGDSRIAPYIKLICCLMAVVY